jgi:RNA polymerase sigma-70 factor (ECF subfamily)
MDRDDSDDKVQAKLVELARARNNEAFTILVRLYEAGIGGYLLGKVGNQEDARDLAQQTFLKAWQELPRLRDASSFKFWLYRIATNLANDHWRNNKKRGYVLSLESLKDHDSVADTAGPEEQVTEADLIQRSLTDLPPKFRDCLLLQIQGGFSQREIAELLDISEGSVGTYISYARKRFRQAYWHQVHGVGATVKRSSDQ